MKQKILSFVVNKNKFLALRNNPHPNHGGDFWFVVTGELDKGESYEEGVKREVKEETGLKVVDLLDLNWGSAYEWNKEVCEERNFLSFVESGEVKLNEENIDFEWLDLDKFIKIIKWSDDKELLKKVLKKALNKENYFEEFTIKDYREEKNE